MNQVLDNINITFITEVRGVWVYMFELNNQELTKQAIPLGAITKAQWRKLPLRALVQSPFFHAVPSVS